MSDFLTKKIISETKTASGKKKYTVQQLRKEVRQLIKESNKILYDLDQSKKAGYMKQIAAEIQQGRIRAGKSREGFVQMNVKYMTSKQLTTAYNALTAFVKADKESVEYAKRLSERKKDMLEKTNEATGLKLTAEEYDTMYKMWEDYDDIVSDYGYKEIMNYIQTHPDMKPGQIVEDLNRGKEDLKKLGFIETDDKEGNAGAVLKYLSNERAVKAAMRELVDRGFSGSSDQLVRESLKIVGKQKK